MFDPLDGSSNVDAGLATGTIFGVLRHPEHHIGSAQASTLLQPGSRLVAAGYCLYGPATTLVLTVGNGVHGFTFDPQCNQFLHTHRNMRIPRRGNQVMLNLGNMPSWDTGVTQFVQDCMRDKERTRDFRYSGALVGDVHSLLTRGGGVFGYPGDAKSPNGKLRLLYEANPMAFLLEQAGGVGTTGVQRIRDIQPTEVHQRVPTFLGSPDDVHSLGCYMQYRMSPDLWI
mmetsp:Transcript_5561/g.16410  ORF Transcript_5561/g.16410 Transcript_5561/m.16410 type:complete len:228 (-) Transcript_5561:231-914(-)